MSIDLFSQLEFLPAIKRFFRDLKVPINYVTDEPTSAKEILKDTYKENDTFQLIKDVHFVGMVDDAAFEGNKSLEKEKIKSDYDGILIFGITLIPRRNGLLPTRSQLAEIARAFNREFYYTPVVVVFKYENLLALANTERIKYKQEWREGEKAGKVSLLRDINIEKPHRGHNDILQSLKIPITGNTKVDSFTKLYTHWQEVFSVSVLNKKFYQELSTWYFWATKHVSFPGEPTVVDAHHKNATLEDLQQEHKATNVIRMLTRLLFAWFIKEKKLIPEDLFDLDTLQKDILNEISPYHETGIFKERNKESVYYKAILQNLFFATLNCPIDGDSLDKRKRGFRGEESKGKHYAIDWMMRYQKYFKNPGKFLDLVNSTTPFLNGGLFECLDDKPNKILIDGFSDNQSVQQQLIVPDYLFFGLEEETDISDVVGIADKKYKSAAVKGLLNILKSYKFTINENTPIEEDVALDPELLGKVFENLLASYNPETKTTARKQTGSFYTPREIVNYMVDESLIAYLKNKILSERSTYSEFGRSQTNIFGNSGETGQQKLQNDLTGSEFKDDREKLDKLLHELVSFNPGNPFIKQPNTTRLILDHLSTCTILDPACGSGAFPMGILQKMVHILQKLDPDNILWRKVQEAKAKKEAEEAFDIDDKEARNERLNEISDAFDQSINDPDYARKLFLIENCIYGVDIQPIATQISKLRFFISLVVEQKVNSDRNNFGIRPLPNLETKFVAANTLVGIERPSAQLSLYDTKEVKALEKELKKVRSKLFSAKSKDTKLKYRLRDEELRTAIAKELKFSGWKSETAEKLADWNPYDQNSSSQFFDPEWMFDVTDRFDIVIGNPPYLESKKLPLATKALYKDYTSATGKFDLFVLFIEVGIGLCKAKGLMSYINPTTFMNKAFGSGLRNYISSEATIKRITDFGDIQVFENATNYTGVFEIENTKTSTYTFDFIEYYGKEKITVNDFNYSLQNPDLFGFVKKTRIPNNKVTSGDWNFTDDYIQKIIDLIKIDSILFKDLVKYIFVGIQTGKDEVFLVNESEFQLHKLEKEIVHPILKGKDVRRYKVNWSNTYVIYPYKDDNTLISEFELSQYYPNTFKYLTERKELLKGRPYFDKSNKKWFELWCERKFSKFKEIKIVNAEIAPENRFFLDRSGYLGNTKTFNSVLKDKYSHLYSYIIAILNSKLLNFYHKLIASPKAGGFFDYKTQFISQYPIKISHTDLVINLVEILECTSNISSINSEVFSEIIDSLIFEIYFSDHMKEQEIDVVKLIEEDVYGIMKGRNFSNFEDLEKEKIITLLQGKWVHPDSEVRNRIKLFAVRSPLILKPIIES